MLPKITPGECFKDNLARLPAVDGIQRIDLADAAGAVLATIENAPGKQGSLAVYNYLHQTFGRLDSAAAAHGLDVFGEHTPDARRRPGAHPNVDRLIELVAGGAPLEIRVVTVGT